MSKVFVLIGEGDHGYDSSMTYWTIQASSDRSKLEVLAAELAKSVRSFLELEPLFDFEKEDISDHDAKWKAWYEDAAKTLGEYWDSGAEHYNFQIHEVDLV